MNEAIDFTIEYGMYGAYSKPQRGSLWRARMFDRALYMFPSGSADTPWEALAWALVTREELRRGIHAIAYPSALTPAQRLAELLAMAPPVAANAAPLDSGRSEPAAPPIDVTPRASTAKKPAAARRARARKG